MRKIRIIAALVVGSLVTVGVVAPAADAAPPSIASLTTSPTSLTAAGGSLTVNASVSGASTCTFTTTPDLGSSASPVSCSSGSFARTVTIPANTSTTATKQYTLSLEADSAGGSATRTLTLTQPAQQSAGPKITSLTTSPSSLTSAGGTVTISASISNGQTCDFTTDPAFGGGTTTSACTTSFSKAVSIPANTSTTDSKIYGFSLHVSNPGGDAYGSVSVVVPPASSSPPTVNPLTSSPTSLTASGGSLTVSGVVSNATTCTFTSTPDLGLSTASFDCRAGGTISRTVTIPANSTGSARTYSFTLKATNSGGTASRTLSLTQPAASAPAPTVNSLSTSPTTLSPTGGSLTVTGTVSNATSCTLTSSPDLGLSTAPFSCSSASAISRTVSIPANNTSSSKSYTFTLTASATSGASASRAITLTQPGSSGGPTVGPLSTNPTSLTPSGGSLTVSGVVSNASTCTFTSSPDLGLSSAAFDCSAGGTVSRTVTIPANTTTSARTYTFTLKAIASSGAAMSRSVSLTQNPSGPTVNPLTTSPTSLTAAGGSLTVSSSVSNATSCTFTSTPDLGIDSSPFACNGAVSRTVTIPANTTGSARDFSFELRATGPGGSAGRGITLTQPAQTTAAPTATTLSFSPASLPSGGGTVTVSSSITGGSSCAFSVSPTLSGGGTKACSSGTVSSSFTVPANTGTTAISYVFKLVVTGPGGSVTKTYGLTQLPPAPTATTLSFSPTSLPAGGTTLTVSSSVTRATSCAFTVSPTISGGGTKACSSGAVSSTFTVPANTTGAARTYTFYLKVTGSGGAVTRAYGLTQPAAG